MFGFKISKFLLLNVFIVIFLLALPYLLFDGKLFLGGDDTRLFYSYPLEFIKYMNFYSWNNISSIGTNNSNQYLLPFLTFWYLLSLFIQSKVALHYLAFSFPLILGFIYFQKAAKEFFSFDEKNNAEVFIGSLFYIFSPILIINQLFIFLTTMWLIGLIPIVGYYLSRYLKNNIFSELFKASVWCFVFSSALFSIPWILGFILPLLVGIFFLVFMSKKEKILMTSKKIVKFFSFIFLTQSFWILSFIFSYLNIDKNSFAYRVISKGVQDTFTPTVLATATGTIIYPLLGLFHRQIPFDFGWALKDVFVNFYDKTFFLNSLYIFIVFIAILNYKKILDKDKRKIFIFLLISFTTSLYLFTINIGPLKNIFLFFKFIPGFVMFRNFYDKFAPGFVIIYSLLIVISLYIIRKKFKSYLVIYIVTILLIFLNFSTVRATVNSPLWGTKDIYRTITISEEYLNFMNMVKNRVPSTDNILTLPFGTSIYSVIKDKNTNNVYVGVSPVKIFSGVNDLSGHLSFNYSPEADTIDGFILNSDYKNLSKALFMHNVNYVFVTKNIPPEVKNTWIFDQQMLKEENSNFLGQIIGKRIIVSSNNNYELYETKRMNSLINSKNIYFQKISPVEYKIYLKNVSKNQILDFMDSYHGGWKLYLDKSPNLNFCVNPIINSFTNSTQCNEENTLFKISDINYFLIKPVFDSSHKMINGFYNEWTINPEYIRNNFNKNYYIENKDGSLDIEMTLYFKPQTYFYLGAVVTFFSFFFGVIYLIKKKYEKN